MCAISSPCVNAAVSPPPPRSVTSASPPSPWEYAGLSARSVECGRLFERRHLVRLTTLGAEMCPVLAQLQFVLDRVTARAEQNMRSPRDHSVSVADGGGTSESDSGSADANEATGHATPDGAAQAPERASPRPTTALLQRSREAIETSERASKKFQEVRARVAPADSPGRVGETDRVRAASLGCKPAPAAGVTQRHGSSFVLAACCGRITADRLPDMARPRGNNWPSVFARPGQPGRLASTSKTTNRTARIRRTGAAPGC